MDTSRLSRGVAWFNIGLGLAELTLPRTASRLMGLPRNGGLVHACAAGKLATGVGLLLQPDQRPWLWARLAGGVIDLSLLSSALQRKTWNFRWQLARTVAALGTVVLDLYTVVSASAAPASRRAVRTGSVTDAMDTGGPMESWRGSGLAEDVGAPASAGGSAEEDPARDEKMREAQRQLGLPDPEPAGSRT